jgi:hypothetical protein
VVLAVGAMAFIPGEVWVSTMEEAMRQNGQEVPANMDPASMARMQQMFAIGGGAVLSWIFSPFRPG